MGLFSKLFGNTFEDVKSPVGVYVVNNGVLGPLMGLPENSSVYGIGEFLGYPPESYHTIRGGIEPFECIAVPFQKKEVLFAIMADELKDMAINMAVINTTLNNVNWELEWDLGWSGYKDVELSPVGIYFIKNGILQPLMEEPANSSVNGIGEFLGYPPGSYHTIFATADPFDCIAVPFQKKEVLFALIKKEFINEPISMNDINDVLNKVNWAIEGDVGWNGDNF